MIQILARKKDGSQTIIRSYTYSEEFIAQMNKRLASGEIVDYEVM